MVKLGVLGGGGGGGSMFQEGRGLHGVSEEGGVIWVQGSHSLGEKAVEQSGGAGSDALNGAPVECGEDGWRETCSFQTAEKV